MASKRRNNGRSKKNRGHTPNKRCDNCNKCVPKDKAIKIFTIKNLIDGASFRDVNSQTVYESYSLPKVYHKIYMCINCGVHKKHVRTRSREDRKIRKREMHTRW